MTANLRRPRTRDHTPLEAGTGAERQDVKLKQSIGSVSWYAPDPGIAAFPAFPFGRAGPCCNTCTVNVRSQPVLVLHRGLHTGTPDGASRAADDAIFRVETWHWARWKGAIGLQAVSPSVLSQEICHLLSVNLLSFTCL